MTHFKLITVSFIALALGACGGNESHINGTDSLKNKAHSVTDLAEMDVGEMMDYLSEQSSDVTEVLKTVTDEASAKAAINDLRQRGLKFKAALETFEDIDENEISLGMMRKLPKLMQNQADLISEISRINEIAEARNVIQSELDKLKLGDLKFDQ